VEKEKSQMEPATDSTSVFEGMREDLGRLVRLSRALGEL